MTPVKALFSSIISGGSTVIAYVDGDQITAEQCKFHVAITLKTINSRAEHSWLLWADTPYFFLVQFCALCLSGKRVVLPGNSLSENLDRIADDVDAVLSQSELLWKHPDIPQFSMNQIFEHRDPAKVILETPEMLDPEIVLYTSGSTGEPKAVVKTLSLLFAEVEGQNRLWGNRVGTRTVVSTVSHQHIYGMLHSVLWPLYRGAAFVDPLPHLAEEIYKISSAHEPCVLVSSPTHLKRMAVLDCGKGLYAAIFSSAGRLGREQALALTDLTGIAPFEIFGSTETGGVAWRQQLQDSESSALWTALPGVLVSLNHEDECLKIASDYVHEDTYVMSDQVSLLRGQTFFLKGRNDKVLKVEGKRLSVTEMEEALLQHPWVSEAKVIVVNFRREEVSVVLVLNDSGEQALANTGKLAVNRALKHHLSGRFEMPLLPRRWRYVHALPQDLQGKVTYDLLKSLFVNS